ncbi:MAG TPA: methionine adenosyltransferase [Candidatus Methylomirabilis sp.]|nr:methionine adenosyltransferase [Candidatus Methylomirabilis sp.]
MLSIEALNDTPISRRRLELVERKGLGHPDTISDSLVEAISVALNQMYLERLGAVAHYNVDKALLVAGQCAKGFGWGEVTVPMSFYVGDRATYVVGGQSMPVEEVVRGAVGQWVTAYLPGVRAGKDLQTRFVLAPGSEELQRIYTDREPEIASNDTCGASGYAPLSATEELVLAVEGFLNSPEFKVDFPDTGQDVKVLAMRQDDRVALTIAMPLSCLHVGSERAYFSRKEEVSQALMERFRSAPVSIDWRLNCLDRSGLGTAGAYLTLTGISAEDADSGQVGQVVATARMG